MLKVLQVWSFENFRRRGRQSYAVLVADEMIVDLVKDGTKHSLEGKVM